MSVPTGSPLNYPPGSQPPIKRVAQNRAPTTNDSKNVREGDEWLDTSSSDWYKLADITGQTATWVLIGGTAGSAETLTGDSGGAVSPDAANNIDILGTGSVVTTGDPANNTLTIGDAGDVATLYTEDTGTAAPAANNINLVGGGAISTSGSGSTVTITDGGLSSTSFVTDSGTAVPSSGIINLLGGSGLTTSGSGNSVTIDYSNLIETTTWSPTVEGSGTAGTISYATQGGRYCRLGPLVIVEVGVSWTTIGTAAGDLVITGFPLTWEGGLAGNPIGPCFVETLAWGGAGTQNVMRGITGTTTAKVFTCVTSGGSSALQIAANGNIQCTIVQIVAL